MKKNLFMMGLLAMGLAVASCGSDGNDDNTASNGGNGSGGSNPTSIPEGTADVTINEDNTDVTSANVTNWVQYAVHVANLLTSDATTLKNAWAVDYKGGGPFATTFKTPGQGAYKSYNNCLQEIIEGCADIANEVGVSKIGEPRDLWENGNYTEAVYAVESWYSFHSIDDYSNNILSIRNSFYGSLDGTEAANSIAAYTKAHRADIYAEVKADIDAAYKAIQNMAAPFRSHIGNPSVETAKEACAALEKVLTNKLKPVITSADDDASFKLIVENYVDNVVLPTYNNLVIKNTALNTAIRGIANNPCDSTFKAGAMAWLEAREPWETSEAFLFGPVADLGLDPNMDSWPLDANALKNVLENGNYQDTEWTGEFNEDDEKISAAQNVRGFHTLEFLLFKNGQPRTYKK